MKVVYIISTIVCLITAGAVSAQNYSLSFDGVDDYVQVNNFSNQLLTNELTLECWLKVENGKGHVLSKRNGNSIDFHLEVAPQNQKLYAHLGDLGNFFGTTALSNNTWYHVAVTYDNQSIKIFLNGTLDGELQATGSIGSFSSTLNIGSGEPGGAYFDGLINELRISNIARYTSNFTPPLSEFETDSNTIALFHFNEGSGTSVTDASGNGNHGTIYGATWSTETPTFLSPPLMKLSVLNLDFGEVQVDSSIIKIIIVSNTGDESLLINNVSLGNTYFSLVKPTSFPVTIEQNDSLSIVLMFTPPSVGEMADTLNLVCNDPNNATKSITLTGIGVNLTTGVQADNSKIPDTFELSQNFPNPFNPTTEISFQLPRSDKVTLKIYNMLGQEIRTLVDEQFTAGIHTVRWDGKDNSGSMVSSGVFIYRIHTDSFSQIKKMLLVK